MCTTWKAVPMPETFLETLAMAERDALLEAGRPRRWEVGQRIIRAGDHADTAIVLRSGVVKVHASNKDGAEVILGLSGPGDLLGEITATRSGVRSADVTALEAVDGVMIGVQRLRDFLANHPDVTLALLDLALTRLRLADRRRLEFATAEALPRVASRLIELAERFGTPEPDESIVLSLPITQEELASWSGSSRESTARALRTLRDLKLIKTRRRHLTVIDLERLRSHAPRL
jgi:CRP/FNR family cyclic AMP-dependent transcriptional regulator